MNSLWIHWSESPLDIDLWDTDKKFGIGMKPKSNSVLWVTDEATKESWSWWCKGEDFRVETLKHAYEVQLNPEAKILTITSPGKLILFQEENEPLDSEKLPYQRGFNNIDWDHVGMKWDAVLITPYLWDCRLDPQCFWYYGWDCASGVLMRPHAIANIRELPLKVLKKMRKERTGE